MKFITLLVTLILGFSLSLRANSPKTMEAQAVGSPEKCYGNCPTPETSGLASVSECKSTLQNDPRLNGMSKEDTEEIQAKCKGVRPGSTQSNGGEDASK